MRDFKCDVCEYKPISNWSRLRSMRKGHYSERYKCFKCGSIYKIKTQISTMYNIFFLLLLVLSLFRIIPFLIAFILILVSYPLYLIKAPLILIQDTSK